MKTNKIIWIKLILRKWFKNFKKIEVNIGYVKQKKICLLINMLINDQSLL